MFDVITFGSSAMDIFFQLKKDHKIVEEKEFTAKKGICFPLGSKVRVENVHIFSGGGGTNTAATFSKQGFKTAFCGKVGDDSEGREIVEELKRLKVNVKFVSKTSFRITNTSAILNSPDVDRTILAYRGASELLEKSDIPWDKLDTEWFYLAPLSGSLAEITKDLIDFAHDKKIKVAFNPGNSQLSLSGIKDIIYKVNILILNQEESSFLTGIDYRKEKEIFEKIDEMCPGIVVMTKGEKGVTVSDGKNLYRASPRKEKVEDRTGAGDSFGSGFVSGFINSKGSIEKSIQLGIENATGCLKEWGAKNGLLEKSERIKKVKVEKFSYE